MSLPDYCLFVQAGLMSVGHARLSTHIFKRSVFIYRGILYNKITGMIPSQMSALVKLERLCALTIFIFSVEHGIATFLI